MALARRDWKGEIAVFFDFSRKQKGDLIEQGICRAIVLEISKAGRRVYCFQHCIRKLDRDTHGECECGQFPKWGFGQGAKPDEVCPECFCIRFKFVLYIHDFSIT